MSTAARRVIAATRRRLAREELGLSKLELLGLLLILATVVAFITPLRNLIADLYDTLFAQRDETGQLEASSQAAKGIIITLVALAAFIGTPWLVLYTDLGSRLSFLVTGAATFGWLVIGSALFVVYAPRGVRPENLAGLNSFQIRIPAIAMTLASFILFMIFVVALDRYESEMED